MKIYHQDYSIIAFAVLHTLLGAVMYIVGMMHQENDKEYAVVYKGAGFSISFVSKVKFSCDGGK